MISLKKYLEMEVREPQADEADPIELLAATLESYRSVLLAMGKSGVQAYPTLGSDLQRNLANAANRLADQITPPLVKESGNQVTHQLQQWGDRTSEYFKAKTTEVKELLIVLARTAESVGERDQRYTDHFAQFTSRLQTISNLEDLTQVRASLVQQATELKTHVDRMKEDSHKLVAQLQSEVSTYEAKLKEVEELALRDALTGLANRRYVEEHMDLRITRQRAFCVVMLDLNRLKHVNDKYGHLAGDNLLQQFSQELRSGLRSSDMVGRWGGDEFILVMDCDLAGAKIQIERLRKWVFGEYTIRPGKGTGEVKVDVDASVGLTQWQPGETIQEIIERADADMYRQKELARKQK
ncbi:MAG: GGDEF domain-containing protein [Acidobacteriia bacterium]|nr:GGDEF domain-containing protein [Terriglobia bacterium]